MAFLVLALAACGPDTLMTDIEDPVAAIDATAAAIGIDFVRPPDLDWRPECGPTDEVLGRSMVLDVTLPNGFSVPDDWDETGPGSRWLTPEGTVVFIADEGAAFISAPATTDQIRANDRVADDPTHVCG